MKIKPVTGMPLYRLDFHALYIAADKISMLFLQNMIKYLCEKAKNQGCPQHNRHYVVANINERNLYMSTIGYINVSLETFGGLLSLIFICCLYIARLHRERLEQLYLRLLICNTVLLFCDASAWLFKGRTDTFSFFMVRISNFLVFALGYLMLALFTHYFVSFLRLKDNRITKTPFYVMNGLMLLAFCLVVVSQFNHMYYVIDEYNIYHRQSWFWLSQAFGITGMILNSWLLFHHRKKMNWKEIFTFATYICLPATAMLFQILFYSIAVLYLATTICLLCIYISIQMALSQETAQKKVELEAAKTAIMLSQIQPHFLYNALQGIKEFCDDSNPTQASEALEHFSYYLRGNLDSLVDAGLVPFEKELTHIEDYLYLEKMRFPQKLNIQMELSVTDFRLPPLTVQPLIENAIRHGIVKKKGGGTLTIKTEQTEGAVIITVADDGVGFDTNEKKEDGRSHIGIENTRSRLEALCGGALVIESKKGVGTTAKIALPPKEVSR